MSPQTVDALGDKHIRAFYPSLHANIGDAYLPLGNLAQAQEHIDKVRETERIPPDGSYGRMIQSLIVRLTQTFKGNNS